MDEARIYTVDASVFVNAFNSNEPGYQESRRFLARCQDNGVPLIEPTLLSVEVAAAISRGTNDSALARNFALNVTRLPHVVLVTLDDLLARQAADIAASHRLRGSDAIYAAVAIRFGSALVTLDMQQYERASGIVATQYPIDALGGGSG